ncbi:hypothetical protein SUGI_0738680 [Cryptomeria japonica]|nr:hypothetical protein SUGI_0738680 [Cryptomeria japonica]
MLIYEIKPARFDFLFPSISDQSCTSTKGMDMKQWYAFLFYHHTHKGHLIYNVLSILWKEICFSLCHAGISGLLFALSFPLNANSEICRSIIPASFQNLKTVTLSVIYALEIAVLHSLCPGFPFYGPICGTLAGVLYSHKPQIYSNWNSLFLIRRWLCSTPKISGTIDSQQLPGTVQMVWRCSACTYDNSVTSNPNVCSICENPRFETKAKGSPDLQVNPDKVGLVWNCPTCTYENGVFFLDCEMCERPRPVLYQQKIESS